MAVKTYKRETAWVVLLWVIYISIWGTANVLSIIVYPAFAFITAAYGFDWYSKQLLRDTQIPTGRGSEGSS